MDAITLEVFREIENNMFIIQFFHWKDKEKVLNGRPWTFDQKLVLLQEINSTMQPSSIMMIPFWIRIYNMPLNCRSIDSAKALAGNIEAILDVEQDVIGWDRFMCVQVMLDVTKPIRRLQKFRHTDGKNRSVEFKYKRLPIFCFRCGVMGHIE